MTPSLRTMPVVEARFEPLRRAWIVRLPGNVEIPVPQADDVPPLVARYAPGSAIRYVRANP